jgi:hypothetical protein
MRCTGAVPSPMLFAFDLLELDRNGEACILK